MYVSFTWHESVEPKASRRDADWVRVNLWSQTDKFASCMIKICTTPRSASSDYPINVLNFCDIPQRKMQITLITCVQYGLRA